MKPDTFTPSVIHERRAAEHSPGFRTNTDMNDTPAPYDSRVSVVVLTYNRADELERSLRRLQALPERPRLIVVDNGSHDDTAERVQRLFSDVTLVRCVVNTGAAGRNLGVERVRTPYVAFCDDDTWWEPGALARAADLFDAHPNIGVISGRVLVGDEDRLDPACERMAASPLDSAYLPGPALIAFMAGAVVMRVSAYLEVGGYEPRLFLGAEEQLMALDLAVRHWQMIYACDVVTHHHPSAARDPIARGVVLTRNRLWIAWMRLPLASAARETAQVLREARAMDLLWPALLRALAGLPWVIARRKVVSPRVHRMHARVFGRPPLRSRPQPRVISPTATVGCGRNAISRTTVDSELPSNPVV